MKCLVLLVEVVATGFSSDTAATNELVLLIAYFYLQVGWKFLAELTSGFQPNSRLLTLVPRCVRQSDCLEACLFRYFRFRILLYLRVHCCLHFFLLCPSRYT